MKLSSNTTMVLKNFATINQNLVIKEGSELLTMSSMKNIVAKATVEENFPKEIAIYDLNEFLASLSIFKSPVLEFEEQYLTIKEEDQPHKKLTYFYSDPSVVQSPTKTITMPSEEVKFHLDMNKLLEMKRAAGVIGSPDMVLQKSSGNSSLLVKDKKNDTANNYSSDIKTDGDGEYKFFFKVENLKLFDGDYDVKISSKNISHFKNDKSNIEYWIALEPESTYSN
ncbi:MAG: DNA polymerase [Pseudomonadota bacterium]|jgi:hypothetical protein|nr:DNA polymerase [Pseudomonadota bacterium]MEC8550167.1 DNA polymerase [Pseudomonadota bacterium]